MQEYQFEKIESFSNENGEQTTRFCLKNLEPSYGITIGNTLRRILLTDLTGTAITSVRINGINNEYGTIPGVREDILELLLNFKLVKFKGLLESPYYTSLNVVGPHLVTAGDIPLMNGLKIVNSKQYIATILEQAELKFEVKIESGKGYRLLTDNMQRQTSDFLSLDTIFTPVKNVSYNIVDVDRFDNKFVENLELEITTYGTLTPSEALMEAAQILQNLFGSLTVCEPKILEPIEVNSAHETRIEELQLSIRAYNCLRTINIRTIEDLKQYSIKELKEIKNFGQKSADEVAQKLKDRFDIRLK